MPRSPPLHETWRESLPPRFTSSLFSNKPQVRPDPHLSIPFLSLIDDGWQINNNLFSFEEIIDSLIKNERIRDVFSTIDTRDIISQEGILTEFDDADDELIDIPPIRGCSSDVSTLINHYRAFSHTLQANSATGVVGPEFPGLSVPGHTKVTPLPDRDNVKETGTISEDITGGDLSELAQGAIAHDTRICAVIPAYNEQVALGSIILLARLYVDRVIVIDDGSTDRSSEVATLAGAEVLRLEKNSGKARALNFGLRHARDLGYTTVVMLDADGQHFTRNIPDVVALVLNGEADLVIGSRFIKQNGDIPFYRKTGLKVFNLLTNLCSEQQVTDSQSGFRALGGKALQYIDFASEGFNVESDMIEHFSKNGLVIKEVPINVRYDVPHKHKKHPVIHGAGLLSSLITLITYRRPLIAFSIPGFIIFIVGIIFGSMAFAEYYITSKFSFVYTLIGGVLLILGLLLFISGLILNTIMVLMKKEAKVS